MISSRGKTTETPSSTARTARKEVMETNIVFWLLVVGALVFLWFFLNFLFRDIGKWFLDLFNDTKKEITKEENEEEKE